MASANAAAAGEDAPIAELSANQLSAQGKLLTRLRKERADRLATFNHAAKSFDRSDAVDRQIELLAELESLKAVIVAIDQEILTVLSSLYRELG